MYLIDRRNEGRNRFSQGKEKMKKERKIERRGHEKKCANDRSTF